MVSAKVRRAGRSARSLVSGLRVESRVVLVDQPDSAPSADAVRPLTTDSSTPVVVQATRWIPVPSDDRGRNITVLVPVYNAFDDVQRCVASLIRNTTRPVTLLLIDDASPDDRIGPLLESFAASSDQITLSTNSANLGFVATVNAGFAQRPDDDVIILNSDTEVPPRWVELFAAAGADPTVATVTAMSNNAGAFSAPNVGQHNELPGGIDDVGRSVAQHSERLRPEVPTGHGFAMLIKREALDDLNGFDEENFGRGYCEENDFCMRAAAAGWRNVVADDVLVAHHGSASFGDNKAELLAVNRARLSELHPTYSDEVQEFLRDDRMAAVRGHVAAGFERVRGVRPRVLFVLHAGGGGTPQTNADLMNGVSKRYEPILLRSTGSELIVTEGVTQRELERIHTPGQTS